jgi:hypothetical protein
MIIHSFDNGKRRSVVGLDTLFRLWSKRVINFQLDHHQLPTGSSSASNWIIISFVSPLNPKHAQLRAHCSMHTQDVIHVTQFFY